MRESGRHQITVKGGKFLEIVSEADTIVFDKTGTLTNATPTVVDVIPFGGNDKDEMLRIAACLEEHYPHSIANAVVEAAKLKDLAHEEMHSEVEYVVAHGITSSIENRRVSIGSYHFVFEDEGCRIPEGEEKKFDELPEEYSLLYLSEAGELAAVICIEDPVRESARAVIAELREKGFDRIVMMTGDSRKTAAYVAAKTGVDEFIPEVLPEDKAEFVRNAKENGHKVIISFNTLLIFLGAFGVITPATSALMHNLSTVGISAYNMTDLIGN